MHFVTINSLIFVLKQTIIYIVMIDAMLYGKVLNFRNSARQVFLRLDVCLPKSSKIKQKYDKVVQHCVGIVSVSASENTFSVKILQ